MPNDKLKLTVRYKFKGDRKAIEVIVTEQQYVNLLEVDAIESCEILKTSKKSISEAEKQRFNQKIILACKHDQSHTKYLLE